MVNMTKKTPRKIILEWVNKVEKSDIPLFLEQFPYFTNS